MTFQLPIIDISPLATDDADALAVVAREIGTAAREIGFLYVVGHGLRSDLMAAAFDEAAEFFRLPMAAKTAIGIDRIGDNRGYVAFATEALDPAKAADPKEAFNIGYEPPGTTPSSNGWPDRPGFRAVMEGYFAAVLDIGRRLHRAMAIDLGVEPTYFDDKLASPMAVLRLLHYPPRPEADRAAQLGAGEHTDYGNLTLLATDDVGGLEVRGRDGRWHAAPVVPGAFVVNIGDCLMRWSNDVYVSTPHRVVSPAGRERYSIAFFLDPAADALVSPLPSCVPAGETAKYPPITALEHLRERLAASYGAVPRLAGEGG